MIINRDFPFFYFWNLGTFPISVIFKILFHNRSKVIPQMLSPWIPQMLLSGNAYASDLANIGCVFSPLYLYTFILFQAICPLFRGVSTVGYSLTYMLTGPSFQFGYWDFFASCPLLFIPFLLFFCLFSSSISLSNFILPEHAQEQVLGTTRVNEFQQLRYIAIIWMQLVFRSVKAKQIGNWVLLNYSALLI